MISHPHRCIFVHIPKCGGQSVETMFLRDLGLTWEQRAPLLMRPAVRGEPAPPMVAHLLARDFVAKHYISQGLFESYFKFAIVRDPHERAASIFRFLQINHAMSFEQYLTGYLTDAVTDPQHPMHWFVRPQVDFVYGDSGLLVDRVIKLEDIDAEVPDIARSLGVANCEVPRVNESDKMSRGYTARMFYRAVTNFGVRPRSLRKHEVEWSSRTRGVVRELYCADFEQLSVGEQA